MNMPHAESLPSSFPMTEKQKMLSGMLFNPFDDEIQRERAATIALCHKFNQLQYSDFEARQNIIREILPNIGSNIWINQPFKCDLGYNITIGDNFIGNYGLCILDFAPVKIGRWGFIGPRCTLATSVHPMSPEKRNSNLIYALPITIGDNVWFATEVKVMAGVTIGNNVVVGMGSVVTSDIPDNSFAAGCPARVIRRLTEYDMLKR